MIEREQYSVMYRVGQRVVKNTFDYDLVIGHSIDSDYRLTKTGNIIMLTHLEIEIKVKRYLKKNNGNRSK